MPLPRLPASTTAFDVATLTQATLRMEMTVAFSGHTPAEVFAFIGDPQRITDWYLLAKAVHMRPPGQDGQQDFDVEFAFFGLVREEILHWDAPRRYVYKAAGDEFPILDYAAMIEIDQTGEREGLMRWTQYFDEIRGEQNRRLLPLILPPINAASLKRLAGFIGGYQTEVKSFF